MRLAFSGVGQVIVEGRQQDLEGDVHIAIFLCRR